MELKLLTRLRLGLSHLASVTIRFNHNFQSRINPLCSCSMDCGSLAAIESTTHFLLHYHHYFSNIRSTPLKQYNEVLVSIY